MTFKFCPRCASPLQPRSHDAGERLSCTNPDCGFVHWDNPLPVVAALVEHEGRFILARNAKWPRRIFSVISGFLDQQESPEQAVLREVKEELNLDGVVTRFIGHYPFPEKNQLILAYAVQATGVLEPNQELAEIKRLSRDELQAYDFAPLTITTAIVNDWLASNL
jgi:NAD+ diphosphatase